jgi:hypothetical protein
MTSTRGSALDRRRQAAARYQPARINLLLVAEAPPAALDRYFYFEDVREQDTLFRYVCRVLLEREPSRTSKQELLLELRSRGVFLIDLKETPVDSTPLATNVPSLVERCRLLNPHCIVLIKVTVYDAAYRALVDAGLPVVDLRIPFPGSGPQHEFLESFRRAVHCRL